MEYRMLKRNETMRKGDEWRTFSWSIRWTPCLGFVGCKLRDQNKGFQARRPSKTKVSRKPLPNKHKPKPLAASRPRKIKKAKLSTTKRK